MIEYKKMSKKAQKIENAKKRTTWENTFGRTMPHSYVQKNGKTYSRKTKHKTPYFE